MRKKLATLSLGAVAALMYATALLSSPAPAASCWDVCVDTHACSIGRTPARNTCTGARVCVVRCVLP